MRPQLSLVSNAGDGNIVASEVRRDAGNAALFNKDGEVNAYSNKDLLNAIAAVITACQQKGVPFVTEEQAVEKEQRSTLHRQLLQAAWDSKEELAALGQHIAAELTIAINRDGFMRRFFMQGEVNEGGIPQVRMDRKEVVASILTSPAQTNVSLVRGDIYYPGEVYVTTSPYIEQKELTRSPGDLLNETYVNALTAIMVEEDRWWKQMADDVNGYSNPTISIANSFLPVNLGAIVENVTRWGVIPAFILLATDFWNDITSLEAWATLIDPSSKGELLATGRLGRIHGMEIISDFHRHPQHKVINAGDVYVVGQGDMHGQYTDRDGVTSLEKDAATTGIPGRGWFMSEQISMILVNDRSVAHMRRIGAVQGDNRTLSSNLA